MTPFFNSVVLAKLEDNIEFLQKLLQQNEFPILSKLYFNISFQITHSTKVSLLLFHSTKDVLNEFI